MDALKQLPREVQVVLGGAVLYVIFSFFDWQQVSAGPFTYGISEWHGIGIIAVLLAIILLVWEIGRALEYKIELGSLTPGVVSAGLALLLLVFTVITFLDWSDFRNWPEWFGLVLSIVIAVAAFKRAQAEGVEMPQLPKGTGAAGGSTTSGGAGGSTPPSEAPPPPPTDSSTDA